MKASKKPAYAPCACDPSDPPRERILQAARELFYRHGIHAVSVDDVAAAADSNKMTLYRHFESKDELIAACMRGVADEFQAAWDEIEKTHAGDPLAQLKAWMKHVCNVKTDRSNRGCALANAAIELPEGDHPARRVIEQSKSRFYERLVNLARDAGFVEPERLAGEIHLMIEGARVCMQSVGFDGPAARVEGMLDSLIDGHPRR